MLRSPVETSLSEWKTDWKQIQPALRKVRRSMAALRTSSLKVMRVSQLDSDILDLELVDILKEQLWNVFSLFKVKGFRWKQVFCCLKSLYNQRYQHDPFSLTSKNRLNRNCWQY